MIDTKIIILIGGLLILIILFIGNAFLIKISFNIAQKQCEKFVATQELTTQPATPTILNNTITTTIPNTTTINTTPQTIILDDNKYKKNLLCFGIQAHELSMAHFSIYIYWLELIIIVIIYISVCYQMITYIRNPNIQPNLNNIKKAKRTFYIKLIFIILFLPLLICIIVGNVYLSKYILYSKEHICDNNIHYCYELSKVEIDFCKLASIMYLLFNISIIIFYIILYRLSKMKNTL